MPDNITYADFKSVRFHLACGEIQHFVFPKIHKYTTPPLGKQLSSFCLLKQGTVVFDTEDNIVSGSAGDFFYVPQGIHYQSLWTGNPDVEFFNAHFRFVGSNGLNKTPTPNQLNLPIDQQIAFQKIESLSDFRMSETMDTLLALDLNDPVGQLSALSEIYHIFSLAYPHLKMRKKQKRLDAIEPAVSYIHSNYTKNEPIAVYAALCHLSESRFHHLFRKHMKYSPVEYRNSLRVRRASYLLSETTQSIEQISSAIGFESAIYFRRVFKYFYGMSPSEFRKSMQA